MRSLLACSLVSVACSTPQHGDDEWQAVVLGAEFGVRATGVALPGPLARGSDAAVDPARTGAFPELGDAVLYRLDVSTPDREYRRYLRFTVEPNVDEAGNEIEPRVGVEITTRSTVDGVEQPARTRTYVSRVVPVHVESFDEDGERLSGTRVREAQAGFLAAGLFAEARHYHDVVAGVREGPIPDFPPTMLSISSILSDDPTLRDIAIDLVGWGVGVSALWHFGIDFSIQPGFVEAEMVAQDPLTGLQAARFPIQLGVNGTPALRAVATVVEPIPPLGIVAGITRVAGFRAADARYRFELALVPPSADPSR